MKPSTSAYGACVSPALLQSAITFSGLEWALSHAQYLSIQYQQFLAFHEIVITVKDEDTKLRVNHAPDLLCGIPFRLDESVHVGTIELRFNGDVIHRIEHLAVPAYVENNA